jgi:CheY-like chemotaxis protein
VRLVLAFPGLLERIAVAGTVRWTRDAADGAGVGIEFEPGAARDRLAEAIERIRVRDPKTVARVIDLLVVEDNQYIAEMIEQGLLGSMRRDAACPAFVIRVVPDGKTALEALERAPCDVMIIDLYVPVVDGRRVIAHARGELGLQQMAIIAFSGGGDEARTAALGAGANAFLDKPMRLRQVLETIQRLVH